MYKITYPDTCQPIILRDLLRRQNISLTLRRKLKHTPGAIAINGQSASWMDMVNPGDTIFIAWPDKCRIMPLPLPLNIIFEDEFLIVINKPAGLLVHPTSGPPEPTLANAVMHHFSKQNHSVGFHPVHRLDRNTSGLILIAKNPHAQHLLSSGNGKNITREYIALVNGIVHPPTGIINAPIGRHPASIIERVVRPDGQPALTIYETLQNLCHHSLLRIRLETGRTHQIRVHLSHIGHPIIGDDLYGGSTELLRRQALHAARLLFTHPVIEKPIDLVAPLPADINAVLDELTE